MPFVAKYLPLIAFLLLSTYLLWPASPAGQIEDDASDRVGDIRYTIKFAAGWAYGTELKTQICVRVALLLTVDDRNALSGAAVRRFSR